MTSKNQRILVDDCDNDRILKLPRTIIDLIMELLPIRDAARTCVLSTQWRYVWADHPSLVIDDNFWDELKRCKLVVTVSIVFRIILSHSGATEKFVLDISVVSSKKHNDINLLLANLCRRGLKVLLLKNSDSTTYTIPSCVFSAPELTNLEISSCVMKAKENIAGFGRLQCLSLNCVTLDSCVLTTPLLESLVLVECLGIRGFSIFAPKLKSLTFSVNDYFNLKPYLMCKNINYAILYTTEESEHPEGHERVNLVQLLASWPMISDLVMDALCFKYLATENIPDILELNLRRFKLCEINLDMDQMAWILSILKNSPLLDTFEISFDANPKMEEVIEIDDSSIIMDYRMEKLRTVTMKFFTASRVEVLFAKILLQNAPLEKLLVEENVELDANERLKILKKLLLLQRGFRTADIIFGENLVST